MRGFLADAVLIAHFALALFVVALVPLVWIGAWRGWRWVRQRRLRFVHVGLIAFIAFEAVIGMICPLTLWENLLRGGDDGVSFVGRWVQTLLYYRAPEWVFTALYLAWGALTLATLRWIPPDTR